MDRRDARKRAFDLAVAVPCFIVAVPLMLLAIVAIKTTSRGPALFSQTRVGRHESEFRCHKLRTMATGTPDLPTHEVGRMSITPIGAFLRRFKIDELPQLWNVLAGEMSIVGPRPCLPRQAELIEHRRRLGVFKLKPGITGFAQANGIDMSTPRLLAEADARYSPSIRNDLLLIFRTFLPRR